MDARRAKGEGLPGGPPTTKPEDSEAARSEPFVGSGRPALLEEREEREPRRSFGGGIGCDGDDIVEAGIRRARQR